MSESKTNWAVFYENSAKYNKGDIVLFSVDTGLKVGVIQQVSTKPLTKRQKDSVSRIVAGRRNCCGRKPRGMREPSYVIHYKIGDVFVSENLIYVVGVDAVNEYIQSLRKEIRDNSAAMRKAASALGYD